MTSAPIEYRERAKTIFERKISDVFTEYQARLLKAGAMDFDDLLVNTVELFRRFPEVLKSYQRRFRHVLVDEYQDTNRVQNELVLMLAAQSGDVCVVGDADQCLPPGTMVRTPGGEVPIEQIRVGDAVLGTTAVVRLSPSRDRGVTLGAGSARCATLTTGGRTVHRGHTRARRAGQASRSPPAPGVYLMHRADRGWRIGQAKTSEPADNGTSRADARVSAAANQEHADTRGS